MAKPSVKVILDKNNLKNFSLIPAFLMQSSLLYYQVWLRLQCQILGQVDAARLYLVQGDSQVQADFQLQEAAHWQPSPLFPGLSDTLLSGAQAAAHKGRLHLQPLAAGKLLLVNPLKIDEQLWGLVVLVLRDPGKQALPSVIKALHNGQQWLQFMLMLQTRASEPEAHKDLALPEGEGDKALLLISCLLKEASLGETAIALVNFLATRLGAVRVSLGLLHGRKLQLEAVSFSANFDPRTQAMEQLRQAMYEALDRGRDLSCDTQLGTGAGISPAHQQLLQQHQLRQLETRLVSSQHSTQAYGVLLCEFDAQRPCSEETRANLSLWVHFAGQILGLKREAQWSWYQALGRGLNRRLQRWFGPQHYLAKALALALMVFCGALFVPAEYQVKADVQLQSAYKYLLVAPQDGYLAEINNRPGDRVKTGQVLAKLKAEDLQLERRKLLSQVDQYRQSYDMALAKGERVDAALADAQMEQARAQLQLIEQQLQRVQLRAPVDGIVVSEDISQTLGAPVKQGDLLFEIAAEQGYKLLLYVDERDLAAVVPGQTAQVKLTSLPGTGFAVQLGEVSPLSQLREGRNYFRVEATLAQSDSSFRPGMTGSARIATGKRALGWIWFHDYWDWLRLHLW